MEFDLTKTLTTLYIILYNAKIKMDKNCMIDVKKTNIDVHDILGKMSKAQESYGMRIINGIISNTAEVNGYEITPLRKFKFYSISYFFDGTGKFWTEATGEIEIKPAAIIVMPPDILNRYGGANGGHFTEDSIRFYGPTVDKMYNAKVIQAGVFKTNLLRKLPHIVEMTRNPAEHVQLNANMELQKFIFDIYNENLENSPQHTAIQAILKDINSQVDKWWQIRELAELAGMSIDTFRRKFLQETGVLPKHYIEKLKISHAAEELISTNRKISAIAEKAGYIDPYHFSRRFKVIMGISPELYRQSFSR